MEKLIMFGQPIVDYLCFSDLELIEEYKLKQNGFNLLPFNKIEEILERSEILFKDIGGCVTNTSIGLSKLSHPHTQLYSIGEDENAQYFNSSLEEYPNIRTYYQQMKGNTGLVVTMRDRQDLNMPRTSLFNHGCSNKLSLDDRAKKIIESGTHAYISIFSFFEEDSGNIFEILDYASKQNLEMIFDAGGIKAISSDKLIRILSYPGGLIANYFEIEDIKTRTSMPLEEISSKSWVIVKNGVKPTEFYMDSKKQFSIAPNPAHVVNCLGAGDAFAAGFLNSYLNKGDFYSSVVSGNRFARHIVEQEKFH